MPPTVIRRAGELRDGDEIVLRAPFVEENNDLATVVEKILNEDDSITLMVRLPHDAGLITLPRPNETKSGSPFDGPDLGDDPDGDLEGYDGA
jgi:hypothetical protein